MKNQFTSRIVKLTFAFMFVLIASSCSEDNETLDAAALAQDQINSELSAKGAKAPTLSVASVVYGTLSYSITGDVCLGDPVTISFNNDQGKDDGLFKMSMWGPNDTDWVNLKDYFSAPNGGIITYTFITEEEGDYRFRGEWNRTGGPTTGTNTGWVPANDDLTPLFTVVNCSSCTESGPSTAYAGNNAGGTITGSGGNNSWWYYFNIGDGSINVSANVWEGQSNDIGDVNYNSVTKMITITLESDWFLSTDPNKAGETVKWYSYTSGLLPTNGRPTPGHAPNKGTSLSFNAIDGHQYYAIHLDVATCE